MGERPVAVVTGASSGIGMALARRLAQRGNDLVVVARDGDRLRRLAVELHEVHNVDVEILPADLTDVDQLARVEARLADSATPVDLLVNNAGYGTAGMFAELPLDDELGQIELNVVAVVRLTHAALLVMTARRSGAVLNVSSVGGLVPGPGNATYSATKAFVTSFSEALHEELKGTGVQVTCVCPGFTRTEFQDRAGVDVRVPGFLWQSADEVAAAALDALERGAALHVPGALNRVAVGATHLAPRSVTRRLAGAFIRRL